MSRANAVRTRDGARDGASPERDGALDEGRSDDGIDARDVPPADRDAEAMDALVVDAPPADTVPADSPREAATDVMDVMDVMDAGGSEPVPDAAADVPADLPLVVDGSLPVGRTFLVSASTTGGASNSGSYMVPRSVSADGRYVVFHSYATNLVAGSDANNESDVFLRDVVAGTTTLVSHAVGSPNAGSLRSHSARISSDGRWVLYVSLARDITSPPVTTAGPTLYLYDRTTGLNSAALSNGAGSFYECQGCFAGPLSADGTYFTFSTTTPIDARTAGSAGAQIYRANRTTPAAVPVWMSGSINNTVGFVGAPTVCGGFVSPRGNDASFGDFVVSGSTSFLAFQSSADQLTGPSDQDHCADVFLARAPYTGFMNGTPSRFSPPLTGATQVVVSPALDSRGTNFAYSATGAEVARDTNGTWDVYVRTIQGGPVPTASRLESVSPTGDPGNGESGYPALNVDGSVLVFSSIASNLVAGDNNGRRDLFARAGGVTTRVSVRDDGAEFESEVAPGQHALSDNGSTVVFMTTERALPSQDTQTYPDIYLRRWRR